MDVLKQEMSGFDIAVVTVELNSMLCGFKISNVYQFNPKSLLLKLRGVGGSKKSLVLEAGRRLHTTSYVLKTPPRPSNFCMALRKYLRYGRIERVEQRGFERIVVMTVTSKGVEFRLVTELFGKGNVILVDQENRILQAMSFRRMRDREILRGEVFAYPPSRGEDPRSLQREGLSKMRDFGELEVVRAVARFLSIGGTYAEEVLLRAGVPKKTPCVSLEAGDLDAVFAGLQEILTETEAGSVKPFVFVDEDGSWVDVAPLGLKRYSQLKRVGFGSFNEALDEYYAKVLVKEKVSGVEEVVEGEVSRLERMLRDQEKTLRESREKAEVYRKIGDVIYRHLNELEFLVQRVMGDKRGGKSWKEIVEVLEKGKSESVVPAVYFEALRPKALSVRVSVEDQTFDLGLRVSAQRNAADFYARAKKAGRKIDGAERALKRTREMIERAKVQVVERVEETSKPLPRKRRREWYEKFRWFHSSDGFLVIGGRDASSNEVLIKRYVEPRDVVFHADVPGAPFAVVKTGGAEVPERTLKEAGQFAGSYSRAWRGELGAIDVYWVSPEQVSKSPPSGEYLPRGAFMIYGKKNYIRGVPLEVAVGVKKQDEGFRVIGGPSEAVASQTGFVVRLVPGRESSGRLAKQTRSRLGQLASDEDRGEVLRTPLEEIQRFIPSGRGAIRSS